MKPFMMHVKYTLRLILGSKTPSVNSVNTTVRITLYNIRILVKRQRKKRKKLVLTYTKHILLYVYRKCIKDEHKRFSDKGSCILITNNFMNFTLLGCRCYKL